MTTELAADAFTVLCYGLFSFLVVFPPTELISAGLTVENVFSFLLGDEQRDFVGYHIRRTALNVAAHSLLPLGFFAALELKEDGLNVLWAQLSPAWTAALYAALAVPAAAASLLLFWRIGDWREHPIPRTLRLYAPNWRSAANSINDEYRRVDKFAVALGGIRRVIVTDSWILLVTSYRLQLSQQSDSSLTVLSQDTHIISHHSETEAQFLTIEVKNAHKPIAPFLLSRVWDVRLSLLIPQTHLIGLRLNALNYEDLRGKLQAPISSARDVIIQQTLNEQFVRAFRETAAANAPSVWTEEQKSVLDSCLGCGSVRADVNLEKTCVDSIEAERDADGEPIPNCRACFCRPMWCVSCMGRWFASQQAAQHPERWLGGKCPCPTCRAVFCLLDVSVVQ